MQLYVFQTSNRFKLDYKEEEIAVDVEPNKKTTLGVTVQYDFISFSIGFAPKFFADNKDNKYSRMTTFNFNMYPGRWMHHFDFYYQKGMMLEADGFASVYLPNLKTFKIGGSSSYIFNENLSFRAFALQNEKQLKSAGSFAPGIMYYYTEFNGRKEEQLGGKIYLALVPSYYYNLLLTKSIFVAGGASLGIGFSYANDDDDYQDATLLTQATFNLSAGYNSDTFYGGVYGKTVFSSHNADSNVRIGDNLNYATAFIGYRFEASRLVKKETKKLKNKLKL